MSKSQHTLQSTDYDEEIDLRELFRVLWAGKWLIGGITFTAAVIAVVVALMLPNIYRSEVLLAPNDQDDAGGLSALAAQYGGLASLAGINIGDGSSDKTAIGLEILKSRKFISEYIESHDILVPLIAATGWDSETGKLKIDSDDYDVVSGTWVRDVWPPRKTIPSSLEAYEEFMKILSASQDKESGFVTVSVEHYSPDVAKQWVDWLIDDLNQSTMRRDVADAEQAIEYLNEQIENTSLVDLQNVFFSLIEEQTKTVMLAEVSDEYLLRTLDPAVVPEMKSKPRRALIVIISALLGSLLATAVILVSTSFRK
jgi:LPS O-antigen subunit length determinant protein (WzzB/FepE family)